MSAAGSWPRAFGGGQLVGDRFVRLVYMDESGISDDEDCAVVAGIVVNADKQYKAVERHVRDLAARIAPQSNRADFVIHAKQLYSGGKDFPRERYSKEARWQMLEEVLAIPGKLRLPVVVGHAFKHIEFPDRREKAVSTHVGAFIEAVIALDHYMKKHADPDEVAMIIAEDNTDVRRYLKDAQRMMQSEYASKSHLPNPFQMHLPVSRVIDTVHFAGKTESPLLQLADVCAHANRRFQSQLPNADRFMRKFLADDEGAMRACTPIPETLGRQYFLWGSRSGGEQRDHD